jgi:hypothetical protein
MMISPGTISDTSLKDSGAEPARRRAYCVGVSLAGHSQGLRPATAPVTSLGKPVGAPAGWLDSRSHGDYR